MSTNLEAYERYKVQEQELAELTESLKSVRVIKETWEPKLEKNLRALARIKEEREAAQAKLDRNKARISKSNAETTRLEAEINELAQARTRKEVDKEFDAYEAEIELMSTALTIYLGRWAETLETADKLLSGVREELNQQSPAEVSAAEAPEPGAWLNSPVMKTWKDIFGEEAIKNAREAAPDTRTAVATSEPEAQGST